jgi:alkanesulfonate monooxygenase SsuD/methylene tetrahydromethanopterin reductase-like flavin-dependent oxidoreductase (luciferase family)
MRAVLWLDTRRRWDDLLALARAAEATGWDAVRVGDEPGGAECWSVLGALAGAVPRVRLDAALRDERGRHPAVVAKLASTVDQLSGGRLLLGLAPGRDPDAPDRLVEAFQVVKFLAQQPRTTWGGKYFRLEDAPLDPKPVQPVFPMMLVGGTPDLAARIADHWSVTGDVASALTALTAACAAVGRDRAGITVSALSPGADELVVPDAALGPDPTAWPEALTELRGGPRHDGPEVEA